MPESDLPSVFKSGIVLRLNENLERIFICLQKLSEDQVWHKANDNTNSVGNLILHLNGNIKQYLISGLGSEPDSRQRNSEFDINNNIAKESLWKIHRGIVQRAILVVKMLDPKMLTEKLSIQGFELSATDALIHVTEHYSYHTGQIALLCKLVVNEDLGFFKDQDLNKLNG